MEGTFLISAAIMRQAKASTEKTCSLYSGLGKKPKMLLASLLAEHSLELEHSDCRYLTDSFWPYSMLSFTLGPPLIIRRGYSWFCAQE